MLHTVTHILTINATQSAARKAIKHAGAILTAKGSLLAEYDAEFYAAVKADLGTGEVTVFTDPTGRELVTVTGTDGETVRNLKADLNAFIGSDEFKALSVRASAAPKGSNLVKADEVHAKLADMTLSELVPHLTKMGMNLTLDRGVTTIGGAGMKSKAHFSMTGELIPVDLKDKENGKAALTAAKAEGKLLYLSGLRKWSNAQKEFIAECITFDIGVQHVTPDMRKACAAYLPKPE